jgi:uncharacterized membrane protein
MKRLAAIVLAGSVILAFGCNKSEPGGPGASGRSQGEHTPKSMTGGAKGATFMLSAPSTTTHLKQGESTKVDVKVDRGSDLKEDITVTFKPENAKGITITPDSHTLKASDKDTKVEVTVTAAPDAAIGDDTIRVTGKAEEGPETHADFKVSVKGK